VSGGAVTPPRRSTLARRFGAAAGGTVVAVLGGMRSALRLVSCVSMFAAMACAADDPGGGVDAGLSVSCREAVDHSDYAWLEAKVFQPSCGAFSACHKGAADDAMGLNLEAGQARGNLVGRPSQTRPGETLVVAGDPARSYLLVALGQRPGTLPPSGTMPVNSPTLCAEKRDAVERWIAAGALP
jgi:hypothetical protein